MGRIDVLVNNAVHTGPGSMEAFLDLTIDMVETKLQANVVSQLVLIKAVLPSMLERGDGTIIDITSAVATSDPPAPTGRGGWGLGYAMSKGVFHPSGRRPRRGARTLGHFRRQRGARVRAHRADGRLPGGAGPRRRYPGAPPSVPASVVAWLAGSQGGVTAEERVELNGTTISAQRFARERALHPDWRAPK